jgi:hypothetical protein
MPCIRSWFHVRSGYTESTVGYCSPRYGPHCLEWEWLVCRREEQIKLVAGPRNHIQPRHPKKLRGLSLSEGRPLSGTRGRSHRASGHDEFNFVQLSGDRLGLKPLIGEDFFWQERPNPTSRLGSYRQGRRALNSGNFLAPLYNFEQPVQWRQGLCNRSISTEPTSQPGRSIGAYYEEGL